MNDITVLSLIKWCDNSVYTQVMTPDMAVMNGKILVIRVWFSMMAIWYVALQQQKVNLTLTILATIFFLRTCLSLRLKNFLSKRIEIWTSIKEILIIIYTLLIKILLLNNIMVRFIYMYLYISQHNIWKNSKYFRVIFCWNFIQRSHNEDSKSFQTFCHQHKKVFSTN